MGMRLLFGVSGLERKRGFQDANPFPKHPQLDRLVAHLIDQPAIFGDQRLCECL